MNSAKVFNRTVYHHMIHHLNCGSLFYPRFHLKGVIYCLLVETNQGLLLVDSGFSRQDFRQPSLLMRGFLSVANSPRDESETAYCQVKALGYDPTEVRQIVLTHLHLDHAGGLRDFPEAQVHVHRREHNAAVLALIRRLKGYDPRQWAHNPHWAIYDRPDIDWFGFEGMRVGQGLEPDIFLIPLHGHTAGHCGVAVRTGEGWLLHAGDAVSPYHRYTDPHHENDSDYKLDWVPDWLPRRWFGSNAPRLRALGQAHGDQVQVISAHDHRSWLRNQA